MSGMRRVILIVVFGAGPCALLAAEVGWWGQGLIRLPISLVGGAAIPIPFVYWMGVGLYSWGVGRLFGFSPHERWARGIRLGLGLHVLGLAASLVWHMTRHQGMAGLSLWYVRYWWALWGGWLALGAAWTLRSIGRWRRQRGADPSLFFVPLLWGYAVLWTVSLIAAPRFTLCATVIGLGGGAIAALRVSQAWGVRLKALVEREPAFLAIVFVVALAFRLFYTTRVMSNPDVLNTGSDGPAYDALAWALVQGAPEPHWAHIPLFAPGYVRFLALIYWMGGRNYVLVCAVQSVIGALTCLLLYDVAKRLFGRTVARIAAVFGALNFLMVFAAAAIGHQAIDPFLTLSVVWCLLRYLEDPRRWGRWIIGIGLLLGWAAVTREGNIVFWLFLIGWFLFGVRAKLGWRTAVKHSLGLSLGFLIMLVPFVLSVHDGSLHFQVGGRLKGQWFVSPNSSVNMHEWFNPWQDPQGAWILLTTEPWRVVANLTVAIAGNFHTMFFRQDFGSFDPIFLVRGSVYSYWMWWYAYALAFLGLGLVLRRCLREPVERLDWWLFLIVIVSRSSVHLFFECAYRHRTPLEPFLIMLAAYGLTRLVRLERAPEVSLTELPHEATDPVLACS